MKHTMMKVLSVVMALTMIMGTFGMMMISAAECEHENCAETKVPATCGTYGYTLYECEDCGYSFAANLIAKKTECDPESVVEIPAKEALCGPNGHGAYTAGSYCGDCGEIFVAPELIAGSQPDCTWEIQLAPATCEVPYNIIYKVCFVCGDKVLLKNLDNEGFNNGIFDNDGEHNYVYEITVAPTCAKNGVAVVTCEDCALEAREIVVLKNDTLHVWMDVSIDATCTTAGQRGFVCTNDGCDVVAGKDATTGEMIPGGRIENLPAFGHNIVTVADVAELKDGCTAVHQDATCTMPGFTHWYCSNEGCPVYAEPQHENLAAAHQWPFEGDPAGEIRNIDYNYYVLGTEWDCVTKRIDTYYCMVCNKEEVRVGAAAKGHNTDYVYNCGMSCATDACGDCTHANRTVTKKCLNADCPVTDTTLLPDPTKPVSAAAHDWVYTGTVAGTCATLGYYTGYCANAGCTVTLAAHQVEIPNSYVADDHEDTSIDYYVVDEPTCSKDGLGKLWCDACCSDTAGDGLDDSDYIFYVIPQAEHVADIQTTLTAKEATCAAAGWTEEKKCNNCGETTLASTPVPQLTECLPSTIVNDVMKTPATCTSAPIGTAHCTVCGDAHAYVGTPNADNHVTYDAANVATSTLKFVPYTAPTCTTTGTHAHLVCTACDEVVKVVADKYAADADVKEPADLVADAEIDDCDAPGCGHSEVTIAALGHDCTVYSAVKETCTAPGMIGGEVCNRCDYATENAGKVIPPHGKFNGTSYVFDPNGVYTNAAGETFHNYEITAEEAKAPTCTEEGIKEGQYCMICTNFKLDGHVLPKIDHVDVNGGYGIVVPATHENAGYTIHFCVNCETISEIVPDATSATGTREVLVWYIDGYTKAIEHNFVDYAITGDCTTPDEEGKICLGCGAKKDVVYGEAPKGHKVGNDYVDLSCTGIVAYIGNQCTACGEIIDMGDMTHDIAAGEQAPTCTEPGALIFACDDCGLHFVDAEGSALTAGVYDNEGNELVADGTFAVEIPALNHVYGLVVEYVPATIAAPGYVVFQCATCGENMEPIEFDDGIYDPDYVEPEVDLEISLGASAYNTTIGAYDDVAVNSGKIAVTLYMSAAEFQYKALGLQLAFDTDLLTFADYNVDFAFNDAQGVETKAYATGNNINIISRSTTPVTVTEVAPNVTVAGEDVAFITLYFTVKNEVAAHEYDIYDVDNSVWVTDFAYNQETENGLVDKTDACNLTVNNAFELEIFSLGDVSYDDEINMGDLVALDDLLYTADAEYVPTADINKDGVNDIADLALLENYLLTNRTFEDYLEMVD